MGWAKRFKMFANAADCCYPVNVAKTRTCFLLVLMASLITTCAAQDTTVHITYKTVAVPASRAIGDLAKISHVDLSVNAPLDSQPVILRFNDVPLQEAMNRIASVLHGSWVRNEKSFTLERTDEIQKTLEDAVYRERMNRIEQALKPILADGPTTPLDARMAESILTKQKQRSEEQQKEANQNVDTSGAPEKQPTEAEAQAEQAKAEALQREQKQEYQLSAQGRLDYRIIQAIDPSILASAPANRTLIFTTRPRPLQYNLDISPEDFQQLIDEQNIWTAADKRVNPDQYQNDYPFSRHVIDPSNARIVSIVSRDENGSPEDIETHIVDLKGHMLLDNESTGEMAGEFGAQNEDEVPTDYSKWNLPSVKLSPLATEIISLVHGKGENGSDQTRPASKELHQFLLDAPNHDPLSLHVSEVLVACAEAKNWNLAASLPDDAADFVADRADQISGADLLQILDVEDTSIQQDGQWMIVQPKHPLKAESSRTNRAALSALLKSVDDEGFASIDAMADFATASGPTNDFSLATTYITLCYPSLSPFEGIDGTGLRLYGMLSAEERQAMMRGETISTQDFSQDEIDTLLAALDAPSLMIGGVADGFAGYDFQFNDMDRGEPVWTTKTEPRSEAPTSEAATDEDIFDFRLGMNYTEFVDSFPSPAISLAVATAQGDEIREYDIPKPEPQTRDPDLLIGVGDLTRKGQTWVSPQTVAAQILHKSDDTITFASCPTACIQLQIQVAKRFTIIDTLIEHRAGMTAFGPPDKLPEHLRKKIDEAVKQMKDSELEVPDQDTGDKPPQPETGPPPPYQHA